MSMNDYDVIVVGAGPAGSIAAKYAAEGGARVLLLEKDRDVGYPVRCAEAVSHEGLTQFLQPDQRWIAATVTKFRLIAPNGVAVMPKLEGGGYVLERRIFDYELARLAANAGVNVITKAYVYDLLRENGAITGVRTLIKDQPKDIRASVIIAADGVESRVGKWAGMDTTCHIKDMESCAQMTLSGIEVDPDVLEFYFGDAVSPGGYLWVFPKGNDTANVGLGLSVDAAKKKSAIRFLHEFVERKYPKAAMLTHIAGGVPCATTNKEIVKGNVILVGDAGRQVNPVTGGGIISGMIGGMIGGQVAAETVKSGDISHLKEYAKRWQKRLGWRHDLFHNIRNMMSGFNDRTYNNICESAQTLPEEKRTVGAIFRAAAWNHPSMILDIAKLYIS
jgi:digeranylgeranylglycerophospholipid reductase